MLKLIQLSFLIFFFQFIHNNSIACTCGYNEPVFCRELDEDENVLKVLVEEFYINQYGFTDRMRVSVLENIHLNTSHDTLLIFGQDGLNCEEYVDQFNISDTLILGTFIYNDTTISYLNGCGLSFLRFENDTVYGQVTDDLTFQSMEDFKTNLFTCIDLEVPIEDLNDNNFKIYPNPFIDKVIIELSEPITKLELIDLNGKILQTLESDNDLKLELTVKENTNGIYFLRIYSGKAILTRKLIQFSP